MYELWCVKARAIKSTKSTGMISGHVHELQTILHFLVSLIYVAFGNAQTSLALHSFIAKIGGELAGAKCETFTNTKKQ